MGNKTLKLYVNDPMGRRCEMNMQAAVRLRDELGLDLVVIKKTSEEYLSAADQPPSGAPFARSTKSGARAPQSLRNSPAFAMQWSARQLRTPGACWGELLCRSSATGLLG